MDSNFRNDETLSLLSSVRCNGMWFHCLRMIAKYYGKNYSLKRLCAQSNNGYVLQKHYKLEDMAEIVVSAIDNKLFYSFNFLRL